MSTVNETVELLDELLAGAVLEFPPESEHPHANDHVVRFLDLQIQGLSSKSSTYDRLTTESVLYFACFAR